MANIKLHEMNRFCKYLFILGNILSSISCVTYYPHTPDLPSVSKKSELILDGGVSVISSVNATINYGINDKFAVQTYGNLDADYRYMIQASLGIYKPNENSNVKSIYFGVCHGIGKYSKMPDYLSSGNYQVYFIQPNYFYRSTKFNFFEAGIGIKTGLLNSNINTYDEASMQSHHFDSYNFLIEPELAIRLGGERLKINLKTSYCYLKNVSSDKTSYFPFNVGLSLNYRIKK